MYIHTVNVYNVFGSQPKLLEVIIVKIHAVGDMIFRPAVIGGEGHMVVVPLCVERVARGMVMLILVDILEVSSIEWEMCCLLKYRHR